MIDLLSTNLVQYTGLTNQATSTAINDAVVTGALKNSGGTLLGSFSLTSTGAGGNYNGYITHGMLASVTDREELIVELTAVSGAYQSFRTFKEQAGYRGRS